MPPVGFETHDLSRRAAADLHLRRRGHWDRHIPKSKYCKFILIYLFVYLLVYNKQFIIQYTRYEYKSNKILNVEC